MSERKQSVNHGTCMHYGVTMTDGKNETYHEYHGFNVIKNVSQFKTSRKGIIAVQDEDVVQLFIYDKDYVNAFKEFLRYWNDLYRNGGKPVVPDYVVMEYSVNCNL